MAIEFNTLQRKTLTAIVDTFVAAVPREDDPTGFYATKGSDVGADVAAEYYLVTHLPDEQLAGLLQLIDAAGLAGFKDQTQAAREALIAGVASMSPEASGAIAALKQLSVLFAYSLPGPDGRNPLWVGMEYPGPAQSPPSDAPRRWRSSPHPVSRRSRRMSSSSARAAAAEWPPRCWRKPASG